MAEWHLVCINNDTPVYLQVGSFTQQMHLQRRNLFENKMVYDYKVAIGEISSIIYSMITVWNSFASAQTALIDTKGRWSFAVRVPL